MREPATWDFVEYSRHDVYGRFLTGWNYQTSGGEQVVNALKGLNLGLGLMTILGGAAGRHSAGCREGTLVATVAWCPTNRSSETISDR